MKTKLQRFQSAHPDCVYCAGENPCESIDHAPPRIFYYDKLRPKGLEVPACNRCNETFSPYDTFFSLLAFTQASVIAERKNCNLKSMISSCWKRFPDAMRELSTGGSDVLLERNGLLRRSVAIKFEHDDVHFTIRFVVARLVAALYYTFTGQILEKETFIAVKWQSNAQPMPESALKGILKQLPSYVSSKQGKWEEADQFEAKYLFSSEECIGGVAFHFHRCFTAFGFFFKDVSKIDYLSEAELFSVTSDGIQPIHGTFPATVRLPYRSRK